MLADFNSWSKTLSKTEIVDRDQYILKLSKGARVLHLGVADSPFTKERAESGNLLHQKLLPVAKDLWGIEINQDAINYLAKCHGVKQIVFGNLEKMDELLKKEPRLMSSPFDVILCCDVIEHIANPGKMLEGIIPLMGGETSLVISTANSLSIRHLLRAFQHREAVHPEHVAYYSFSTLGSILQRYSLEAIEFNTFAYPVINPVARLFLRTIFKLWPHVADGIVFVARRSS